MAKTKKLNSMRVLEQQNVPYEAIEYDTSLKDATEVAEAVGAPEFMVYKTLVAQSVAGGKPFLILIQSDLKLDLKLMAQAIGEKKIALVSHKDAEKLTGLQVGGISALALMQKNWDVYVDKRATELQNIIISAGQRGTQLRLPTTDLMRVIKAKIVDVAVPAG